jgi:hypothetical protein
MQSGKIGRVMIRVRGDEGLDRRGLVIVAEDAGQRIDEGGLAVGADAVVKEQGMFLRRAGENVAGHAPQEGRQVGVAAGHAIKEGELDRNRAGAIRCDGRDLGHVIGRAVRAQFSGA